MAEDNITSWTINGIMIFIVLLGLMGSYVLLVNNEGREEIFDDYPQVEQFNLNLTTTLADTDILDVANINSNLSGDYNPEIAISAADKSGNAISINLQDMTTVLWSSMSFLGALLFGSIYTVLLSGIAIAVVGFISVKYTIKFIRRGE